MSDPMYSEQLARIRHIAHGAYGYVLTNNRAMDVLRLCNGHPVILEPDVPKWVMRNIALDHAESWFLLHPELVNI